MPKLKRMFGSHVTQARSLNHYSFGVSVASIKANKKCLIRIEVK
ncbi:13819_t:CDS:2 [Dentiscutata heterogama]|uniref:13819_t:CDS:1 n=1 Tax=Dentiscutata heterogama TaxID=1316150 RepID=A0ACA9JYB6_9GLOM|nr:13819_t:CDS:2 [Dentiscutata heterogama]